MRQRKMQGRSLKKNQGKKTHPKETDICFLCFRTSIPFGLCSAKVFTGFVWAPTVHSAAELRLAARLTAVWWLTPRADHSGRVCGRGKGRGSRGAALTRSCGRKASLPSVSASSPWDQGTEILSVNTCPGLTLSHTRLCVYLTVVMSACPCLHRGSMLEIVCLQTNWYLFKSKHEWITIC